MSASTAGLLPTSSRSFEEGGAAGYGTGGSRESLGPINGFVMEDIVGAIPPPHLSSKSTGESNISVAVRVRPLLPKELGTSGNDGGEQESGFQFGPDTGARRIVSVVDENVLIFDPTNPNAKTQRTYHHGSRRHKEVHYAFDRVFNENASQQEVYENTVRPLINGVLNGFNATVFAYGATGCGKTHTITGTPEDPGVIFRTMEDLFRRINESRSDKVIEASVSYLEVYNETIRDLLVSEQNHALDLREDETRVVVAGLSEHRPKSRDDVMRMLILGNSNRTRAPTEANAVSSRSHAVLQIHLKQRDRATGIGARYTTATLSIIDLAGSERASSTKNKGERLLEGANINRSLLALGNCINALCSDKPNHIPYRDSKLTRLLKYSLGGNCQVVMIANISPANCHYEETHNTLKYANRAKNIKTKVEANNVNVEYHISQYPKIVQNLMAQIEDLKSRLQMYEQPQQGAGANVLIGQNQNQQSIVAQNQVRQPIKAQTRKNLRSRPAGRGRTMPNDNVGTDNEKPFEGPGSNSNANVAKDKENAFAVHTGRSRPALADASSVSSVTKRGGTHQNQAMFDDILRRVKKTFEKVQERQSDMARDTVEIGKNEHRISFLKSLLIALPKPTSADGAGAESEQQEDDHMQGKDSELVAGSDTEKKISSGSTTMVTERNDEVAEGKSNEDTVKKFERFCWEHILRAIDKLHTLNAALRHNMNEAEVAVSRLRVSMAKLQEVTVEEINEGGEGSGVEGEDDVADSSGGGGRAKMGIMSRFSIEQREMIRQTIIAAELQAHNFCLDRQVGLLQGCLKSQMSEQETWARSVIEMLLNLRGVMKDAATATPSTQGTSSSSSSAAAGLATSRVSEMIDESIRAVIGLENASCSAENVDKLVESLVNVADDSSSVYESERGDEDDHNEDDEVYHMALDGNDAVSGSEAGGAGSGSTHHIVKKISTLSLETPVAHDVLAGGKAVRKEPTSSIYGERGSAVHSPNQAAAFVSQSPPSTVRRVAKRLERDFSASTDDKTEAAGSVDVDGRDTNMLNGEEKREDGGGGPGDGRSKECFMQKDPDRSSSCTPTLSKILGGGAVSGQQFAESTEVEKLPLSETSTSAMSVDGDPTPKAKKVTRRISMLPVGVGSGKGVGGGLLGVTAAASPSANSRIRQSLGLPPPKFMDRIAGGMSPGPKVFKPSPMRFGGDSVELKKALSSPMDGLEGNPSGSVLPALDSSMMIDTSVSSPSMLKPPTPISTLQNTAVPSGVANSVGPIRNSPARRIQRSHARRSLIPVMMTGVPSGPGRRRHTMIPQMAGGDNEDDRKESDAQSESISIGQLNMVGPAPLFSTARLPMSGGSSTEGAVASPSFLVAPSPARLLGTQSSGPTAVAPIIMKKGVNVTGTSWDPTSVGASSITETATSSGSGVAVAIGRKPSLRMAAKRRQTVAGFSTLSGSADAEKVGNQQVDSAPWMGVRTRARTRQSTLAGQVADSKEPASSNDETTMSKGRKQPQRRGSVSVTSGGVPGSALKRKASRQSIVSESESATEGTTSSRKSSRKSLVAPPQRVFQPENDEELDDAGARRVTRSQSARKSKTVSGPSSSSIPGSAIKSALKVAGRKGGKKKVRVILNKVETIGNENGAQVEDDEDMIEQQSAGGDDFDFVVHHATLDGDAAETDGADGGDEGDGEDALTADEGDDDADEGSANFTKASRASSTRAKSGRTGTRRSSRKR
ncbi:kinesin-like protein Klp5 [Quaeritorhiza haematococci]|nr:kinesin-like protein Klp5 [Quaeritorhiza haematococci]